MTVGETMEFQLGRGLVLELGAYTRPLTEPEIEAADKSEEDGAGEDSEPSPARMLVVPGVGIVVRGARGEVYDEFSPEPLLPEIEIEIGGEVVDRQRMEKRTDGHDYVEVQIPRDLLRRLEARDSAVRVRAIVEHPLLGHLESAWKAVE